MKDVIKSGVLVFEINNTRVKKATDCKVNMQTKEVYGFDVAEMFNGVNILNREYLIIDGEVYDCTGTSADYRLDDDYWYDDM